MSYIEQHLHNSNITSSRGVVDHFVIQIYMKISWLDLKVYKHLKLIIANQFLHLEKETEEETGEGMPQLTYTIANAY